MARPKCIVNALCSFWKTADAFSFAHGRKALRTASEPLVDIGLMTYVPDQNVLRRAKDRMQSDAQFGDAQTALQMCFLPNGSILPVRSQLKSKVLQLLRTHSAELIEGWRRERLGGHGSKIGEGQPVERANTLFVLHLTSDKRNGSALRLLGTASLQGQ